MYDLKYDILFDEFYFNRLLGGIETTIVLFFVCLFSALVLAVLLVALRSSPLRPVKFLAGAFIEFQRNVPLLVHMLLWYFGVASVLPRAVLDFLYRHNAEFAFGAVALSLYGAAFISEELRGGLRAIPKTQYESARAIGLGFPQTMRFVIIPQAVRNALPPVVSQSLSLYKNTSVAAAIGVADLMYRAREVTTETFRVFESFSVATAIYFTGSVLLIATGAALARWLHIPGDKPA